MENEIDERKDQVMNYKGYRELECYIKARELRISISEMVKGFPPHEKYMLTNQVIRSSRSITANMAEGYGRYTYADTKNFFVMARGSVTETMEHLLTAFDEKYIGEEELQKYESRCEEILRLTGGYINYLERAKKL